MFLFVLCNMYGFCVQSFFAKRAYVLSKCSLVLFLGNIIWVVSCDSSCECQGEYLGKK